MGTNDVLGARLLARPRGLEHRPETTFGTFNDDFLAYKDAGFQRGNLCSLLLSSRWA
jgi:hypothetical protein